MRSAAYGSSSARPGLGVHHGNPSSSSHNHSPWAATPVVAAHTAPGVASHAAASAYPPLGATPPPAAAAGSAAARGGGGVGVGGDSSAGGHHPHAHNAHQQQQQQHAHHAHHQHNSHPGHHALASAGQNSLQNASTALDRVLAMLDGFEDDMDCPLCLEEMDISDLNFKPCPCGYQICRFCYHHIKENLNNRCPACRTPYDDATVEFKAIKPDEMKRLQAAKKLRDKRRKETEAVMQNKANVRVRQRTLVHITGMTTKQANEDTLAQLKGPEHFGRFGKVVRLFMSKRSPTAPGSGPLHPVFQPVNVYVCYRTASEASHCIAATDGTYSIEGNKLRAMWGTTRYCPNYLKGIRCSDVTCTFAHEAGEEIDGLAAPNARDEIFTYDSETSVKPRAATPTIAAKKVPEVTLPATASWASKNAPPQPTTPIVLNPHLPPLSATLPKPAPPRTISVAKPQTHPLPARPSSRSKANAAGSKGQSAANNAAAATASSAAAAAAAVNGHSTSSGSSPAPSTPSSPSLSSAPTTAPDGNSSKESTTSDANGAAAAAAAAPPVASTSRSPSPRIASPPSPPADPFAAFTASFSNAYTSPLFEVPSVPSFPDFEFGDSQFSFSLNLDVKGKGRAVNAAAAATASNAGPASGDEVMPFRDFANLEGFGRPTPEPVSSSATGESNPAGPAASSAFMVASGLSTATTSASYMGSFDPFSENAFSGFGSSDLLHSRSPTPPSTTDAEDLDAARRGSRFGFARRGSSDVPQTVQGMLSAAAAARSAFGGALAGVRGDVSSSSPGTQTPFAPPGIGLPLRSGSAGFAPLPPLGGGDQQQQQQQQQQQHHLHHHQQQQQQQQREWNGNAMNGGGPAFPPGVLRSIATPGGSTSSSPQMSPRARTTHSHPQSHAYGHGPPLPPGLGTPGGAANSALPPPPGLMPSQHARPAIPAASFPLPPPAPRPNGTTVNSGSTNVAKEDLLALIAAAQASAPKQQQQQQQHQQQQQQYGGQQPSQHPFFSDPAILNARLASTGGAADASLPPPGPGGPALPPLQQQHQQQQHPFGLGQAGSPFPPGMRLPPFHQPGQQQRAL